MLAFFVLGSSMVFASVYWLLRTRTTIRSAGAASGRRATNVTLTTLVPVLAVALYAWLGNVDALTPPPPDPVRAFAEQRTANLASRLGSESDDVAGLRLLARSYEELARFREATETRTRLVALQPDDPDALVDLAEAVSLTQGGSFVGEPIAFVRRALAIDVDHGRALASAANESAARGDLAAAIGYWERMAATTPADSDLARSLRGAIDRAKSAADANGRASFETGR